jgi:hypothetical protein
VDAPTRCCPSARLLRHRVPIAVLGAVASIANAQAPVSPTPVLPPDGDTLEMAVAVPQTDLAAIAAADITGFKFFVGDQFSHDSNVFRLPSDNNTYFIQTVGPNAHRSDDINTASAGVDGQVDLGRQSVALDLRVDDNNYVWNHELNNVGGTGKAVWNWALGSQLGGQIGADFTRSLLGFANTTIYEKDLFDKAEYFGSIRYQVGPRWGIFAGILEADVSLSNPAAKQNDTHTTSGITGADYAVGANTTIGIEYRYNDATYDHILLNAEAPNYHEDVLRFVAQYALTGKLQVEVSGGYLQRKYSDKDAASQGFSGDVWRAGVLWQVSEKTQIIFTAKRDLEAYITEGADYVVDRGENIEPVWLISDKLNLTLTLSADDDDYLSAGALTTSIGARRDKIYAEEVDLNYTPREFLVFKVGFRNEQRDSNQTLFTYKDELANASFTYKFL